MFQPDLCFSVASLITLDVIYSILFWIAAALHLPTVYRLYLLQWDVMMTYDSRDACCIYYSSNHATESGPDNSCWTVDGKADNTNLNMVIQPEASLRLNVSKTYSD